MTDDDGNQSSAQSSLPGAEMLAQQLASLLRQFNQPTAGTSNPESNQNQTVTVSIKLNEFNYSLWSRMMHLAIGGRGCLNHITGLPPPLETTDSTYHKWYQNDLTVISWIIQNMEPTLANNYVQFKTARGLWKSLSTTYSVKRDSTQIFDLTIQANSLKQGQGTIEHFYSTFQRLWAEIDENQPNPMDCEKDVRTFNQIQSDTRLFQLLAGVSEKYEPERRDVLKMDPLPTVEAAYALLRRGAGRRGIWGQDVVEGTIDREIGSGLLTQTQTDDALGLAARGSRPPPRSGPPKHGGSSSREKPKENRGRAAAAVGDLEVANHRNDGNGGSRGDSSGDYRGGGGEGTSRGEGTGRMAMTARVSSEGELSSGLNYEGTGLGVLTPDPLTSAFNYPDSSHLNNDIKTGTIIGRVTERCGLYYVDEIAQKAISTAVYLLNRLPTKSLALQTPLQCLSTIAHIPVPLTLKPRIFGCSVFIHIPKHTRTKLDPCAVKCVFVGYGVQQKGYRCYDPQSHCLFTTMNCDFLETEYFYHHHLSGQRESSNSKLDTLSWLDPVSMPNPTSPQAVPTATVSRTAEPVSETLSQPPALSEPDSGSSPDSISEVRESTEPSVTEPEPVVSEHLNFEITNYEILENTEQHAGGLYEMPEQSTVEPETVEQDTGRYVLPPRSNRGIPPKRYSPERISRKSRYSIRNIARENFTDLAAAFQTALYDDENLPRTAEEDFLPKH
ncbi:hypothetical protein C2S51_015687 [Perilla frutescens var. frutescens]|nr:hypothetical protein C2S51_015687 [Perilla frutescens var. frutescens]